MAVHDVAVHLHVLVGGADIDPIPSIDIGEEGFAALDERREEAALDRPGLFLRDAIEGIGLEDVDAGVDGVAGDFVGVGFFQEPADVAVGVGLHEAVGARILDRCEHDGRLGPALAMQRDDGGEVDLGQDVSVEDDDRFAERLAGVADGAGRAERGRLDHVADADPGFPAVAENLLDAARLVVQAQDHFVDFGNLFQ